MLSTIQMYLNLAHGLWRSAGILGIFFSRGMSGAILGMSGGSSFGVNLLGLIFHSSMSGEDFFLDFWRNVRGCGDSLLGGYFFTGKYAGNVHDACQI